MTRPGAACGSARAHPIPTNDTLAHAIKYLASNINNSQRSICNLSNRVLRSPVLDINRPVCQSQQ